MGDETQTLRSYTGGIGIVGHLTVAGDQVYGNRLDATQFPDNPLDLVAAGGAGHPFNLHVVFVAEYFSERER